MPRIEPVIANPDILYRLDLGEPGLLRRASASTSTLRVAQQEQGNLNRFKSRALREGKTIVFANIRYHRQFRGSFLATVGGETTVVAEERPAPEPIVQDAPRSLSQEEPDEQDRSAVGREAEPRIMDGTAQRLIALQTQRATLERSRSETERRSREANLLIRPYLQQQVSRLEMRIRLLDEEIEKVERARRGVPAEGVTGAGINPVLRGAARLRNVFA